MIRNLFSIIILMLGLVVSSQAQTDQRTRSTKIADIVMLLPADNTTQYNNLMEQLYTLGNAVADLSQSLANPGGNDSQIRAAISGLAMYASKSADKRAVVAKDICSVIPAAKSDEIRDFLFIQLQYLAGDESLETASKYLHNDRLCDAAVRILVRIGNNKAGELLLNALKTANAKQQISIIQGLGELKYAPAVSNITGFALSQDFMIKKAALHALANIAAVESQKTLSDAAAKVNYKYESFDALGSYILYLENRLAKNDTKQVSAASKKMLKATNEMSAKTAALDLFSKSAGKNANSEILAALKSNSKQYRQAALNFSVNTNSPTTYPALLTAAKKEKNPEIKAELISFFGNVNYKPSSAFVMQGLSDSNVEVKKASIEAIAQLDNSAMSVGAIIATMNSNSAVVEVGKNTLKSMKYDNLVSDIATALPNMSNETKIAFLDILSSKAASEKIEMVYAQTEADNANVRTAAFKALQNMASEKDAQRISMLLSLTQSKEHVPILQDALYASLSSLSKEEQTQRMSGLFRTGRNPAVYYNVFAKVGTPQALEVVLSGMKMSGLNDAAFEALTNWSNALAMPALLDLAKNNPQYFDKALTSYVSKAITSKDKPEQKLISLRNALDIAKTEEQKSNIITQIGKTETFLGLITAAKFLDDSNQKVQQSAVQTVFNIALANPEYSGSVVIDILNKAIAVNKANEANYQKQAITNHMASLPKEIGFVSIFNGKDLTGWKGLVENPIARGKMTEKQLAEKQKKADEIMRRDWRVEDGLLVFDGPGYDNLCSEKMYEDFEMYVDWKIAPEGDAGIYLRGSPQVQVWDIALTNVGAQVGSGGLYNNQKHESKPLLVADNPVNEWNSFYIKMIGEKVTVYLNGQLVTDNVTLENYWNRRIPIFSKDAIELQAHGTRVEYRDIYVKEIPRPDAYEVSQEEKSDGFAPMFNGIDMSGWVGNLKDYYAKEGMIVCDPKQGGHGNIYTEKEYSNFVMRFDFKLTPAANNGLGIRTPLDGDAAYVGMELQILDNDADVYKNLADYQYHGSVYGVIAAKRGHLKPVGEWNTQEVIANNNKIKITLNGTVILDGDIAEASKNFTETIDKLKHPGLSNKSGHIGFLGHGSEVFFKNLRIKDLNK